jgi:hypothetical protein
MVCEIRTYVGIHHIFHDFDSSECLASVDCQSADWRLQNHNLSILKRTIPKQHSFYGDTSTAHLHMNHSPIMITGRRSLVVARVVAATVSNTKCYLTSYLQTSSLHFQTLAESKCVPIHCHTSPSLTIITTTHTHEEHLFCLVCACKQTTVVATKVLQDEQSLHTSSLQSTNHQQS